MDILDLDSFRSRYSDITVTAVPAKRSKRIKLNKEKVENANAPKAVMPSELMPPPRVEIIPVRPTNGAPSQFTAAEHQPRNRQPQQQQVSVDAVAYANEYKQVLAKLEYTKYVQAQLQLMSMSNGIAGNQTTDTQNTVNIVEAYGNLLSVIAEMQSNLGPTAIGLRAPKERLLRDIARARVLVRECSLLLMRDV